MKEFNFKITEEDLQRIRKDQTLKNLYGKFIESYGNLLIALVDYTVKHLGENEKTEV